MNNKAKLLVKLAKEPLDAPIYKYYESKQENLAKQASLQETAETLAKKLFELTNCIRTTSLDEYITTVNSVVLNLNSYQNQFILKHTASYFETHFGQELQNKGQSPKLLEQIVHRTGKATRETVSKTLEGFDVEKIALEIWKAIKLDLVNAKKIAAKYLANLTEEQIRELRNILNIFPARNLSIKLNTALHRINTLGRPYPDMDTIKTILLGRSGHEVKQIEFQYDDIFKYQQGKNSLRTDLVNLLSEPELKLVLSLLDGFKADEVADNIHAVIANCVEACEIGKDDPNLHADFAGSFRQNYNNSEFWERELRAYGNLYQLIHYLNEAQFKKVNLKLKFKYYENLSPELYQNLLKFNPRKCALNIYKALSNVNKRVKFNAAQDYLSHNEIYQVKEEFRLSNTVQISEIINARAEEVKAINSENILKLALSPLKFLTATQLKLVKKHFLYVIGEDLDQFAVKASNDLCQGEVPGYLAYYLENSLGGELRANLSLDLFDLFKVTTYENDSNQSTIQAATKIIQLIEANSKQNSQVNEIIKIITALDEKQIETIEKDFFKLSSTKQTLLKSLQLILSKENFELVATHLAGINVTTLSEKIVKNLNSILDLIHTTPNEIRIVKSYLRKAYNIELLELVEQKSTLALEQTKLLSILYAPEAAELKYILSSNEPLDDKRLKIINKHLNKPSKHILALEVAYNRNYGKFEFCYEKQAGFLLERLRILGSQEILPRKDFSRAILYLEGLAPDLTEQLDLLLVKNAPNSQSLEKVEEILKNYRNDLKTVQKSFNVYNKNLTLREAINQLEIKLNHKNKLLLLLDGYDPESVAREISAEVIALADEALKVRANAIFENKVTNLKIPESSNWTCEMYHQIRLAYEKIVGKPLLTELKEKGVSLNNNGINKIAYYLYGDAAMLTIDLKKIIADKKLDNLSKANQLLKFIKKQSPAHRERILNMYFAYYQQDLKSELAQISAEQTQLTKQINELLDNCLNWDLPHQSAENQIISPKSQKATLKKLEQVFLNTAS